MKPRKSPAPQPSVPRIAHFHLRFRESDRCNGVTRTILQAMAKRLGLSQSDTVHMALADMARRLGLLATSKVIINPTTADLRGMDFSGLRQAAARAVAVDTPRKAIKRHIRAPGK